MPTVRSEFVPATDTDGSKIRVTEYGTRRVRTYPFPYEVSLADKHTATVERFAREILGMSSPVIEYADGRPPSRGYRFNVTEGTDNV